MSTKLKAGTATTGAVLDADTTGILELQSGSTPTTAITVDASQNVGIGTSSPAAKLDVQAAACVSKLTSTTGTNAVFTQMVNTGGSFFLGTDDSTGATSGAAYGRFVYGTGAYPMIFFTNSAERMRIDSSGSLLVGITVTDPISARVNGFVVGAGGNIGSIDLRHNPNTSDWAINATSGSVCNYYSDNGSVPVYAGTISVNGNTTAYGSVSDYRLKENIAPMVGALDVVQALKPVTFDFKNSGQKSQGFIAHELQAVVPDCVIGEKDAVDAEGKPVYQGIDTSFLVATLTAAIQEQQTQLTDMSLTLANANAMIEELKNKVTALEAK
jgi:hypothetical protein